MQALQETVTDTENPYRVQPVRRSWRGRRRRIFRYGRLAWDRGSREKRFRTYRQLAIRNDLRQKSLFVSPDHDIVPLGHRRYAFVLLEEDQLYRLPSLGYTEGRREIEFIHNRAVADSMSNIKQMIQDALTYEFDRREVASKNDLKPLATKDDLKPLATQATVNQIGADVTDLATAVGDLRSLVETRLNNPTASHSR